MKWPSSITLVRHGESQYNELRRRKDADPRYQLFKREFEKNNRSDECRQLAEEIRKEFFLGVSDYNTALTARGRSQSENTAYRMRMSVFPPVPDVAIVSPYLRTRETFEAMQEAWPTLASLKPIYDDRVREQEHGLSLLYNDWRVFQAMHPEQKDLRDLMGPYWYQYPNGESVPMVRDRLRLVTDTLIREYSGANVMIVSHHLTKLSFRANFERLSPEEFIRLDVEEKPINCGVTFYRGDPNAGKDGKLKLEFYNRCFWK